MMIEMILLAAALVSLTYAVLSAPGLGIDLAQFRNGAIEWVNGTFRIGQGQIGEYPPFALPVFAPMAFASFQTVMMVSLVLKLAATALSLWMTIKLWGGDWPVRIRIYLAAFLLSWAPFRVTMRVGQISLFILALLLGAILARQRNRTILAGLLTGFSLCKYTLSFPFVLYFAWKREWRMVATALIVPLVLTEIFALRLDMPLWQVIADYLKLSSHILASGLPGRSGTTEIRPLILDLTGGNELLSAILILSLSGLALICMSVVFSRTRGWESAHFAAVALFCLWAVYHRTYDSVMCLMPASLFVGLIVRGKHVAFSRFWLCAYGLLIVSIPGLLVDRLKLDPAGRSANPLLLLGLHIERLLVFGSFCSLLFLMWKSKEVGSELLDDVQEDEERAAAVMTVR